MTPSWTSSLFRIAVVALLLTLAFMAGAHAQWHGGGGWRGRGWGGAAHPSGLRFHRCIMLPRPIFTRLSITTPQHIIHHRDTNIRQALHILPAAITPAEQHITSNHMPSRVTAVKCLLIPTLHLMIRHTLMNRSRVLGDETEAEGNPHRARVSWAWPDSYITTHRGGAGLRHAGADKLRIGPIGGRGFVLE
jgi:hypothetical protein